MPLYSVKKYTHSDKELWDNFIAQTAHPNFLFYRDFMEYHSNRFEDYSILIFHKNALIALLPANVKGTKVYTHQGLSYGGLVLKGVERFESLVNIFQTLLMYFSEKGFCELYYKEKPFIYGEIKELSYQNILFLLKAEWYRADTYLVIPQERYHPNRNRRRGIKKAIEIGLTFKEGEYKSFWEEILVPNLQQRFGVNPVHSLQEIELLASNFPNNIHCITVHENIQIKAGAVLFEFNDTLHFQYSSGADTRNEDGSLDYLFDYVCRKYSHKKYVSFGSSSEENGRNINKGLMYWKESYGAISIPQKFYKIEIKNQELLSSVFL